MYCISSRLCLRASTGAVLANRSRTSQLTAGGGGGGWQLAQHNVLQAGLLNVRSKSGSARLPYATTLPQLCARRGGHGAGVASQERGYLMHIGSRAAWLSITGHVTGVHVRNGGLVKDTPKIQLVL